MTWCCCQQSDDIFCQSLTCDNWAVSSSSAWLNFRHQLMLTWQRLDWENMHVLCAALSESKLDCWRDDIFLCCSVSFCWTFFILVICIENLSAHEEIVSVVSMLSHELLMNHRRLALEKRICAICALSSVLQDILRDVLWSLIHEDWRWFSWLLQ